MRIGLLVGLACLIADTGVWAQSAAPAEIQPRLQARPVQVAAATENYQSIKTPGLIIVGGPQPVPPEIQPEFRTRPAQVTAPTPTYRRIRTPGLLIVGE